MLHSAKLKRRSVLQGIAGAALALPPLEAMGSDITDESPKRFCAIYTANGMSLPKTEHGIDQWSWFPTKEKSGEFVFGKSTLPLEAFRKHLSFVGGLYHENGVKAGSPHLLGHVANRRTTA